MDRQIVGQRGARSRPQLDALGTGAEPLPEGCVERHGQREQQRHVQNQALDPGPGVTPGVPPGGIADDDGAQAGQHGEIPGVGRVGRAQQQAADQPGGQQGDRAPPDVGSR